MALAASALLTACGSAPVRPAAAHIQPAAPIESASIPAPVLLPPAPPEPKSSEQAPRYTIVVRQVPVQELLQAVARDTRVNIDIHPAVTGLVSLNAVEQTLPQILLRITRQTKSRFRVEGPNLVVEPDTPFLRTYAVDYVNATRNSDAEIGASSQVSALSSSGTTSGGGGTGSSERVVTSSQHHLWQTLVQNLKDLLHEGTEAPIATAAAAPAQRVVESAASAGAGAVAGDAGSAAPGEAAGNGAATSRAAAGSSASAAPGAISPVTAAGAVAPPSGSADAALVIANPEAGMISVRATSRQHERVQEFLDRVLGAARRQVLIEATVVEVSLNDNYRAGIDWTRLNSGPLSLGLGDFAQNVPISTATTNPGNSGLAVRYASGGVSAAINLLDTFGNTRVLSSPKLMALNNQTALLKVVDNLVYFNITSQYVPATNNSAAYAITTATPRSVSVGLIMAVTPQISESGTVSLIVRPTISRVLSYVTDPSTNQNASTVANLVPQIQVREMESILSVQSGQIAVLGGLMQQSVERKTSGVPGLGQLPAVGDLFNQRNDNSIKTELVVFLRPVVIDRQQTLPVGSGISFPDPDFFQSTPAPGLPAPLQPAPLHDRHS
jgi:general secretion pathway protein D